MPADIKAKFDQQPFEGKYEYICLDQPPWARERDDEDDDDDENEEPLDSGEKLFEKPASEHPDHKWILMRESLELLSDNCKETMQRDPDNFGMYVYNDYFWYAVIDLIERLCKSADTANKANDVHKLWAIVAAMGHFLNHGNDADRIQALTLIVGRTVLTALENVRQVGELHKNSKFKDLGLVMALYVNFSAERGGISVERTLDDNANTDWVKTIVAYALKADINITEIGVAGIEDLIENMDVDAFDQEKPNWKLSTSLNTFWRKYHTDAPIMGGGHFNITKWSRAERAEHAFDKEDPLKDFSEKDIKSGKLMPA
ncbi:hypothetical protein Slin15195_G086260 [Septoria linicola]|uniref:Uncharacterized protein n=1 Tax=Septoria linicola TaxID=215465 RepID=A0A9Q9EM97_9PEZI|nr:hypothetical protein Slin14017_G088850 [Septoria linicola]USW55307.1 hypothetical protein Slin15195_G086260 [Septoria linicola]